MDNRNYAFGDEYDIEGGGTVEAIDAQIFGEIKSRDGRMVARPIPLSEIWPDLRQPRRAIPLAIRGEWDGNPEDIPDVLGMWHDEAAATVGIIDILSALRGGGDELEVDPVFNPVLSEYIELVNLASSILRDGLENPITVVKRGSWYQVETGERRWLAFHILRMYADAEKYAAIPAFLNDRADVWRQAAENGARRPLNAIGMARQLALLVMDMYTDDDGVKFGEFGEMVYPGENDRRFYAQVVNANVYPIKRGMSDRVLAVTGLKSRAQISQYRNLLNAPDDIWVKADLENWPEHRVRDLMAIPKSPSKPFGVLTMVNTSPEKPADSGPRTRLGTISGAVGEKTYLTPQLPLQASEGEERGSSPVDAIDGVPTDHEPVIDEAALEDTRPVAPFHVEKLLAALAWLNDEDTKDAAVAGAVKNLRTLSAEDVRLLVTQAGGLATYESLLAEYAQVIGQYLHERVAELNTFQESLRGLGRDLRRKYGEES